MHKTVTYQDAVTDGRAYAFIEHDVFWPGFKKYLKERHHYDYTPSLAALDYHKYAGDFQAIADRYVAFEGRVFFWKIREAFLEPEVWEFDATELAVGMSEWSTLRHLSLFRLLRWHFTKKNA